MQGDVPAQLYGRNAVLFSRNLIFTTACIAAKHTQKRRWIMDLVSIVLWIVLGALAGWIASIIMGKNAQMGAIANIVVGIVGALIGGFVMSLFGQSDVTGFNLYSLLVAILGAVILLAIVGFIQRARV
jgi:uncharacterized membrane protein YeaQ/YmgE (transglycosylase-associated protein family)